MATITKASCKAYFETGDRPTQAQFVDLVDSYQDFFNVLQAIGTAATGGALGIVRITGTAAVTALAVGAVGIQLVNASATTSALSALGITAVGVVGNQMLGAAATASALGHLGITAVGAVGNQVLGAAATASALGHLGAGAVGNQLLSTAATASAQNQLSLGTAANPTWQSVSVKDQKIQAAELRIQNSAGTLRIDWEGEGGTGGLGNFIDRVTGATNTTTDLPTGTDSSTDFAGGAKVSSANTDRLILNTAAQTALDCIFRATIEFNDTGTDIVVFVLFVSRNVNGTTRVRPELALRNRTSGATFAINTTNIASGQAIRIRIGGYLA